MDMGRKAADTLDIERKRLRGEIYRNDDFRKIYSPKLEDKIDNKLSRYLNTYPEREDLKILFLRESEGVYRFG